MLVLRPSQGLHHLKKGLWETEGSKLKLFSSNLWVTCYQPTW